MTHHEERSSTLITIHTYTDEYLEACRYLWVVLTQWHRDIYDSQGIGGPNPGLQFDEHLAQVGPDLIWVAKVDEQVVGMTGLILKDGEGELEPLVVLPAFREIGIGRLLARTVIDAAQRHGVHQLSVRPVGRNREAIQVFHALGFRVLGHIELFMDLTLTEKQMWQEGEELAARTFKV